MVDSASDLKDFEFTDESFNKVVVNMQIKDYMFYKLLDNIRRAIEGIGK